MQQGGAQVEADACPQCGHPNRPTAPAAAGPNCYACTALATTKCQRCGALSCAQHLQPIRAGDGFELRCESCYSEAVAQKQFGCVFAVIIFIIMIIFILGVVLSDAGR